MGTLNKHKTGLVLGSVVGLWHLFWSCLVAMGVAQWMIDWIFRLHFIQPAYEIAPFQVGFAVTLILVTSAFGYVFGWLFAAMWDWLHPATGISSESIPTSRGRQPRAA